MNEQELFALLIESSAADRGHLLDRYCAESPQLRERMERLLAAHDRSHPIDQLASPQRLGPPGEELETRGFDPAINLSGHESIGAIIGPYTLEQRLGEGGMGTVWVAKQREPVKRRVALKLIKAGMDSREVLARFSHERQALAVMDHPNIAKVLDAGLTPEGRPYFAMELVNGLPLTKFCDEAKLTTEQRLEVFSQVCLAVQHAHQKGLIHRDLKPANILVTLIDGKPVPKVIDFGVSKALSADSIDRTTMTHFGAVLGTLEYMAPEQAGFSGTDVDTRADIYALGVILYELLTGLRPFDPQRMRQAAIDEVIRIIREEEPSKPSTRLSNSDARPSLAAARGSDPTRLARAIRGDLDWIALKCLEKDRNRRYETANQLALEIKRYLADEPIHAGPPITGYLLRKFLRRNRRQVFVGAILVAALCLGLLASLWQMKRALVAEQVATQARDDEAEQRRQAEELRIKAEANAQRAIEGGRQAREALDTVTDDVVRSLFGKATKLTDNERQFFRRMLGLYDRLAEFDQVDDDKDYFDRWMTGYWRITEMQYRLGAFDDSKQALERMEAAIEEAIRRHPEQWWLRLTKIAALRRAIYSAQLAGDKEGALRLLDQADAALRAVSVGHADDLRVREYVLLLAHDRAGVKLAPGTVEHAAAFEPLARQAEALLAESPDNEGLARLVLSCVRNRQESLFHQKQYAEAIEVCGHCLELLEDGAPAFRKLPADFRLSQRAGMYLGQGKAFAALGQTDDAVRALEQGLALARERLDTGLPRWEEVDIVWAQLAWLHSELGIARERQGKLPEAVAALRAALADADRWSEFVVDPAPVVRFKAWKLDELTRALNSGGGGREEALAAALACAEFRAAHLDQLEPRRDYQSSIAGYRELAASILSRLKRGDEAIEQRRQAETIRAELVREHSDTPFVLHARMLRGWNHRELSNLHFAKNDLSLAAAEFDRAIDSFREVYESVADDAESQDVKMKACEHLGHAYHGMADNWYPLDKATAIGLFSQAIEWKAKAVEERPADFDLLLTLAWAWRNRGNAQFRTGNFAAGAHDFQAAIKLLGQAPPDEQRAAQLVDEWASELDIQADAERAAGRADAALPVFRFVEEQRRTLSERLPESHVFGLRVTWSLHNVCIASIDAGKLNDALDAARRLASACREFSNQQDADWDTAMNLCDTVFKAGQRLLNAGQPAAARELYAARLAVRLAMARRFPEKPTSLEALMFAHYDVFQAWLAEGNVSDALPAAKASIDAALQRKKKFPEQRASHAGFDRPVLSICHALFEANQSAAVFEIVQNYLREAPAQRPADLPLSGPILAYGGRAALAQKKYADAEPLLRESLAIFAAQSPNDWQTFNVRCYLGEALLFQEQLEAAEALLVEGYQGLLARRAALPVGRSSRLRDVVEQLKRVAVRRDLPENVQKWEAELKRLDGEAASETKGP